MIAIFFKRILLAIPVLFAVASITFFLVKAAPGGPFDADRAVSPQVLKNLNEAYNLDASNWEQYVDYMSGLIQGDLGPSFRFPGRSVTEMIATGLPITFELAFYAILIALLLGVLSGVTAALKRNTFLDFIPMAIAMIGICVPTFLMGPLLVLIFGINLEVLPVSGWGQLPGDKILPSITLGFAYAPGLLVVLKIFPIINMFVDPVVVILQLAAMTIAVRQALDFNSTVRAVGVCIVAFILSIGSCSSIIKSLG